MCGIVGEVRSSSQRVRASSVRAMQAAIAHRGPSGAGNWNASSVSLGMRRLSIIDVAGGGQPLFTEDESIVIIGNGEIYNYKELNVLLSRKGHVRKTGSDIETVAHLYEEYGVEAFSKLRGMFALCLHDTRNKKVYLVRDKVGEKPLYWTRVDDAVIFASEMKALRAHPAVQFSLRTEVLPSFFSFYYIPEPDTAIAGIHKLPPGSYACIDLATGTWNVTQYWSLQDVKPTTTGNPIAALRDQLHEIGKISLRADVPVGISLSGGVDSAVVLSLAAQHAKKNLIAFTAGYAGSHRTDERARARALASAAGVAFVETEIAIADVVRAFPTTVYAADDPVADIASYAIYRVAAAAAAHRVPVLLGGIGGDELFWGYPWMRQAADAYTAHGDTRFYQRTAGFARAPLFLQMLGWNQSASPELPSWAVPDSTLSSLQYAKFAVNAIHKGWLLGDCLVLGDRMSMAASVELRLPLVDAKLMETVVGHSKLLKAYDKPAKSYLQQAVEGMVPSEIFSRPKQGFTPPVREWVYAIVDAYLPLLMDGYLVQEGIISRERVRIMLSVWKGLPFWWYQLYCLCILEVWCREFLWQESPESLERQR